MTTKILLIDTFNQKVLSTHKTIMAAVTAREKHLRAVKLANGKDSYLTYSIRYSDGSFIDWESLPEAR